MTVPTGGNRSAAGQLREARRRLIDDGEAAQPTLRQDLIESWQRCRDFGLIPDARNPGVPHASEAQLSRAREQQQTLLSHARPVMQFMSEQIRESASMVILADSRGMLLHAMGDDHFVDRAARVALRPGANWHEQWRGTNAIGTALHERSPTRIHGAEHYLERNAFLTCAAAPIIGPAGQLLGAIDISGDHRSYHSHTLGLVRSAARMIEHQLFDTRHAGSLRMRLHSQVEGIGTVVEGLLALSEDGWIIGANSAGLDMLGLAATDIGGVTVERVMSVDLRELLSGPGSRVGTPRSIRLEDGRSFWIQIEAPRSLVQSRLMQSQAEDARQPGRNGAAGSAQPFAAPHAGQAGQTGDSGDGGQTGHDGHGGHSGPPNYSNHSGHPGHSGQAGQPGRPGFPGQPGHPDHGAPQAPGMTSTASRPWAGSAGSPGAGASRAVDAAPRPDDALAALDTGDGAMAAAIVRARKVIDKPIALLLLGESGVGKELFARACHDSGARRDGPFVAVNCAALPESLIEAELFGYRPGAFTGASRDGAPGRIREAEGGTLFLDEIGDMPAPLQARLLRVLQEREVVPLGGGAAVAVDFQLICATHRRLRDDIAEGRFREDLYYRLNGLSLPLPPLRERSDLQALIAVILSRIAPGQTLRLTPSVASAFVRHSWPGNLRQLSNVLRTAIALADDAVIDWDALPADLLEEFEMADGPLDVDGPGMAPVGVPPTAHPDSARSGASGGDAPPWSAGVRPPVTPTIFDADRGIGLGPAPFTANGTRERGHWLDDRGTERPFDPAADPDVDEEVSPTDLRRQADRCIEEAVRLCDGNLSAAARRLGVSRNTLYRRLRAMSAR